jgi:hypothetical protein
VTFGLSLSLFLGITLTGFQKHGLHDILKGRARSTSITAFGSATIPKRCNTLLSTFLKKIDKCKGRSKLLKHNKKTRKLLKQVVASCSASTTCNNFSKLKQDKKTRRWRHNVPLRVAVLFDHHPWSPGLALPCPSSSAPNHTHKTIPPSPRPPRKGAKKKDKEKKQRCFHGDYYPRAPSPALPHGRPPIPLRNAQNSGSARKKQELCPETHKTRGESENKSPSPKRTKQGGRAENKSSSPKRSRKKAETGKNGKKGEQELGGSAGPRGPKQGRHQALGGEVRIQSGRVLAQAVALLLEAGGHLLSLVRLLPQSLLDLLGLLQK